MVIDRIFNVHLQIYCTLYCWCAFNKLPRLPRLPRLSRLGTVGLFLLFRFCLISFRLIFYEYKSEANSLVSIASTGIQALDSLGCTAALLEKSSLSEAAINKPISRRD